MHVSHVHVPDLDTQASFHAQSLAGLMEKMAFAWHFTMKACMLCRGKAAIQAASGTVI